MANYNVSYKTGHIGKAQPHAEYVLREGRYSKGRKKEDLQYKESGNMPKWGMNDPVKFWESADIYENINGRTYREFEVSLPNELSLDENIELMKKFKDSMLGKDFAYTYAIHTSYNNSQKNTHAHFMFTERKNDGIERDENTFFKRYNFRSPEKGGAKKDRVWQKKETLLKARKLFAEITNNHLERAGFSERVDHRSNEDQLKEALEKGDIDKVDYLTRQPVNIDGKILNKSKERLTEWEKNKIIKFHEDRRIKRKKEAEYKESKKQTLGREELLLEIKKIEKRLQKDNLKKSAINAVTNGEYYKLLNKNSKLRKELKSNPDHLQLKVELSQVKDSISRITEEIPSSASYKKKYRALERAYNLKRADCLRELRENFNIHEKDIHRYQPESKISAVKNNFKVHDSRLNIDLKNYIAVKSKLNTVNIKIKAMEDRILNKEETRMEAMDNVSAHRFSLLKLCHTNLKSTPDNEKIYSNIKRQCSIFYSEINKPEIRKLIDDESSEIINNTKKSLEILSLQKEVLEKAFSSAEKPSKEDLNKDSVERLIDLKAKYITAKFNIDHLKKKVIKNTISRDNKKLSWQMPKLKEEIQRISELEEMVSLQETAIKKISREEKFIVASPKGDMERIKLENLQQASDKLQRNISSERIKTLALNHLTKGEYNKLETLKRPVSKRLTELSKELILKEDQLSKTGLLKVFKLSQLKNEIKDLKGSITFLENKISKVDMQQEKLRADIPKNLLEKRSNEIRKALNTSLKKIKSETYETKSRIIVSQEFRQTYKPLNRQYSINNFKSNLKINKVNLNELLKDDSNLGSANRRLKIFKKEDEFEVEKKLER